MPSFGTITAQIQPYSLVRPQKPTDPDTRRFEFCYQQRLAFCEHQNIVTATGATFVRIGAVDNDPVVSQTKMEIMLKLDLSWQQRECLPNSRLKTGLKFSLIDYAMIGHTIPLYSWYNSSDSVVRASVRPCYNHFSTTGLRRHHASCLNNGTTCKTFVGIGQGSRCPDTHCCNLKIQLR